MRAITDVVVCSLGMIMLEAASNIVVPDQGEPWHRLRREDLSQVELDGFSPELVDLLLCTLRTDPARRASASDVAGHPVVERARRAMEAHERDLRAVGAPLFGASALASVAEGFLDGILGRYAGFVPFGLGGVSIPIMEDGDAMDLS
jgi:mitosis inhibitor protein kinase SWE1